MKKTFNFVLPIFIMIAIAVACVVIYMGFTDKLPKINNKNANAQVSKEQSENSIILSKKELPSLDAQVNLQPLMTEIVRNFTQDNSIVDTSLNYSENNSAYERLINGEVDVLLATAPNDDILARASAMGVELELIPIAKDGFVFYVNSSNPVDSLKVSDIQKIYSGQITNWVQLGGENENIIAFQRTENSLNQREMMSLVMKNLEVINPPRYIFKDANFGEINDLIACYDNSKAGIGYSYYSDAKILYDIDSKKDDEIKLIKINDIEPNYDSISQSEYPFQTNYYLVRNKNNTRENVEIFINAMLSERGKKAIKEAGYIDN